MKQKPARRPTHPGELLREDVIPATGMSEEEFARRLDLPVDELAAVLDAS